MPCDESREASPRCLCTHARVHESDRQALGQEISAASAAVTVNLNCNARRVSWVVELGTAAPIQPQLLLVAPLASTILTTPTRCGRGRCRVSTRRLIRSG